MAFNINDFKSQGLIFGGARPALFQIQLSPPPAMSLNPASVSKLTFTAKTASLPEMTVGSVEVPYFGRKIKVAGDRTFSDWTITVLNDEDFAVRTLFEKWSNGINRLVNNTRATNLLIENYKAQIDVMQYSKIGGAPIRMYSLTGAFPTTIEAIALDWETQNQVETFNVTLAYDYFTPVEATAGGTINEYANQV